MSKYASITTNKYIDKNKSETIEKRLTPAPIGNKYFQKVINPVIEKSNSLTIKKSDLYELIKQFILKFADSGSKDYAKLSEGLVPLLKKVDNIPELNELISLARNAGIPRGSDALGYIGDAWRAAKAAIPEAITPATIPDITAPINRTASESLVPDIFTDSNSSRISIDTSELGRILREYKTKNTRLNNWIRTLDGYKFTSINPNAFTGLSKEINELKLMEEAIRDLGGKSDDLPKIVIPKSIYEKINNPSTSTENIIITPTSAEYTNQYQRYAHPDIYQMSIRGDPYINGVPKRAIVDDPVLNAKMQMEQQSRKQKNAINAQIESDNARNREQLAASPYEMPDQDLIRINQKIQQYNIEIANTNFWLHNLVKDFKSNPNDHTIEGLRINIKMLLRLSEDIKSESRKIRKDIVLPKLIIPKSLNEKAYAGITKSGSNNFASIVSDVKYEDKYLAEAAEDINKVGEQLGEITSRTSQYDIDQARRRTKSRTASESTVPNGSNRTIYSTADDANTRGIIMNSSTTVPMPTTWYTSGNDREKFQNAIIQYKNEVTDLNKWINNLTKLEIEIKPVTYTKLRQNIKFIQELKAQLDVAFDTYGKSEVLPRIVIPKSLEYKIYKSTSTPNAKGEIPSRLNRDFAVIPTDDKYERDYMLRAFPDIKQRYGNTAALNYNETVLHERERNSGNEIGIAAEKYYNELALRERKEKAAEKAILDAAEKRRITEGRVVSLEEYWASIQAQRANAPENIRALGTRTGEYLPNLVNSKWQYVDGRGGNLGLLPGEIDQLIETGNLGHSNAGWTVTPSDKTRAYMSPTGVADALIAERDGGRPFPSAATARVATPSEIAETKDERNNRILSQYQTKYSNNRNNNYNYMFENPKSFDEFLDPPSGLPTSSEEFYLSFLNRNPVSAIPGSDPRFKTFGLTPRQYYQQYQEFTDKLTEAVKNNDDKTAIKLITQWESRMGKYYKKESLADQQDPAQIAQVEAFDAIENPTDQDVQEYWRNSPGEKIYPHVPNSMQLENNTAWPSLQSVYDRQAAENAEIEANRTANAVAVANEKASRSKRRSANESSPPIIYEEIEKDNYDYFLNQILNDVNPSSMETVIAALPKVLRSNKRVASESNIPDEGVDNSENVYEDVDDARVALEGKSASEQADIASKLIDARTADYSDDEIKFYERTYGKDWYSKYPFDGINSRLEEGQPQNLSYNRRASVGAKTPTYRNETFSVDPSSQRDSLTEIHPFSEKTVYPSDRFLKKRNKKNKK